MQRSGALRPGLSASAVAAAHAAEQQQRVAQCQQTEQQQQQQHASAGGLPGDAVLDDGDVELDKSNIAMLVSWTILGEIKSPRTRATLCCDVLCDAAQRPEDCRYL